MSRVALARKPSGTESLGGTMWAFFERLLDSSMGCDLAQGYLISKPLPRKELLTFLEEDRPEERCYG